LFALFAHIPCKPLFKSKIIEVSLADATLMLTTGFAEQNCTDMYQHQASKIEASSYE
jgi:hypothetical protein